MPTMANPPSPAGSSRVQPNPTAVKGHYFTTSPGQFQYPELSSQGDFGVQHVQSRPNFGVALSGGGFRAATLAAGWINGMRELGVMDKVRYLSSNSGASWFNAALSYQPASTSTEAAPSDDEGFFVKYMDPKLLTLETIGTSPPNASFLHIITDNDALVVFGDALADEAGHARVPSNATAWSAAVAETFLKPFGLDSLAGTVSMKGTNGSMYERIREKLAGQAPTAKIYLAKPGPFPLMVGSVYAPDGPTTQFYPYEFTPLYFGMPSLHPTATPIALGGGYTEPYMADSSVPQQLPLKPSPDGKQETTVDVNNLVPLALMSGISSAFFAAAMYLLARRLQGKTSVAAASAENGLGATASVEVSLDPADLPDIHHLPPGELIKLLEEGRGSCDKKTSGIQPEAAEGILDWLFGPATTEVLGLFGFPKDGDAQDADIPFADGGGNDNLALYPMLRRQLKHVVLLVACVANVNDPKYGEGDSYDFDMAASDLFDVAQVFGALPREATVNGMQGKTLDDNSQVFDNPDNSAWKELVNTMRTKVSNGEPATFRKTYTVKANEFQFVQGGWEVDVLWVWNQKCSSWEEQLPRCTHDELTSRRKAGEAPKAAIIVPQEMWPLNLILEFIQDALAVKDLSTYPLLTTYTSLIYPAPANLLYQQAGWTIKEGVAKDILDMIAAAEKGAAA